MLWVAVHAHRRRARAGAQPQTGNLAASGVQAFGLFFKSIGLLVVLIAALAASPHLAVAAALTYALAYTFELGLSLVDLLRSHADEAPPASSSRSRSLRRRRRFARGEFDPTTEFEQHEWIPIHLGPLNLSITKAVVYLMIGTALTILLGVTLMRVKTPGPARRRSASRSTRSRRRRSPSRGCRTKAIGRWFPYVATLMLFIWVVNMLGFIPLPLTGETWHGVPTWGIYAATSSLSVTLALALLTFVFTHFEGIRWNGPGQVLQELDPRGAEAAARADRAARDPRPVHAAHLAERQAFREHARGPHPDPHVHRPAVHPRRTSSWPSS